VLEIIGVERRRRAIRSDRDEIKPGDKVEPDVIDGHLVVPSEGSVDATVDVTEPDDVHAHL